MALGLVSCGSNAPTLHGYIPPSAKYVGGVSVHEARAAEPFTFVAAKGEMLIVYFGYTHCPDLCPATMSNIKNAKRQIGDLASRVDIAMVTVDPNRDTDSILSDYLSSFSETHHALVPQSDAELESAKKVFQVTSSVQEVNGKIEVAHGATSYVIDDTGHVIDEWPFGMDSVSMANDLTILLTEKGK